MDKICQVCGISFYCSGNEQCWCYKVKLTNEILLKLKSSCNDCLCEKCLVTKSIKSNK